jgi:hypothetical protein
LGSKISRKQSGQVAMSGSTSAVLFPPVSLGRISKFVKPRSFETLDETAWRFFDFEPEQEFFQFRARAFDFNENALRGIVDPAGQSEFRGEAERERTEADALHRAANGEFQARALAGWSGLVHAGILSEPAPN